jgi:osmoprotectant transport system permease protein
VGADVREAATGMGMTELQSLFRVEMPLAAGVIMAGIKTSMVINVGTATIGATIGAGGLGAPIITGLSADNPAFILQGSVLAALFAILVDGALELLQPRQG